MRSIYVSHVSLVARSTSVSSLDLRQSRHSIYVSLVARSTSVSSLNTSVSLLDLRQSRRSIYVSLVAGVHRSVEWW